MDIGTQTHLHALRELLTYRRHDLLAAVHAAALARASGAAPDAGAERDEREMLSVESALQRLDGGVYGDCLECGEPIALQRLLLQPAAERCAACQAKADAALA